MTEDLIVGGAQIFALRLGQALSKDHDVFIFSYREDLIVHDLIRYHAPQTKLLTYKPFGRSIFKFIDRVLYKCKIDFSLYNIFVNRIIKRYLHSLRIDIVHSHSFKVDYELSKILKSLNISWVITTHGDHAVFFRNICNGSGEQVYNYSSKLKNIFQRVNFLVYFSERQLDFTQLIGEIDWYSKPNLFVKIYNGFTGFYTLNKNQIRSQLGISKEKTVFGMVARDNPKKGWRECIEAYRKIEEKYNVALVLVGEGDYLNKLKKQYSHVNNIFFAGFSPNPVDLIQDFDVGLLPTRDDNLPTSVIEYLFCEKPVIASDIGEISYMITVDKEKAGFTLKLNTLGRVDSDDLAICMKAYLDDKILYNKHRALTKKAICMFDMEKCINSYIDLYNRALYKK